MRLCTKFQPNIRNVIEETAEKFRGNIITVMVDSGTDKGVIEEVLVYVC